VVAVGWCLWAAVLPLMIEQNTPRVLAQVLDGQLVLILHHISLTGHVSSLLSHSLIVVLMVPGSRLCSMVTEPTCIGATRSTSGAVLATCTTSTGRVSFAFD
jgi:hypothetical protein